MNSRLPIVDAAARRFRCTGCGGCCTEVWINVTDADVRRLCQATGLSAPEVVQFSGLAVVEGTAEDDGWIPFGEDPDSAAIMTLKSDPSTGACRFLVDDQCSVYAHRPRACRLYPWDIELTDDGPRVVLEIFTECPHEDDGTLDVRTVVSEYELDEAEREAYEERIWDWEDHGAPDDPLEFLRFLGLPMRHSRKTPAEPPFSIGPRLRALFKLG